MDDPRPFAIPGSLPVETRALAGGDDEDRVLAAACAPQN